MATGTNLRTYFDGTWHEGDVLIMRAADHGAWLGTTVFDGARYVEGHRARPDAHLAPGQPLGRGADDHADGDRRGDAGDRLGGAEALPGRRAGLHPADVLGDRWRGDLGILPEPGADRLCRLPRGDPDRAAPTPPPR